MAQVCNLCLFNDPQGFQPGQLSLKLPSFYYGKGYKVKLGFELYFAFCTQIFWFRLNFAESETLVSIFKTQVRDWR